MLVRSVATALIVAFSAASMAQIPSNYDEVSLSMRRFAASPQLKLVLDGTESVNGRGKVVHVEASLLVASTASGTLVGLVEIAEHQNGVLTQRTVGDGQNLWFYNVKQKEYSSKSYGVLGGAPTDYFANLSTGLGEYVEGFGTYPVRYLRDILYRRDTYGSLGAIYRSWIPGFTPVLIAEGTPRINDPVNPNRSYLADPTKYFLHCTNGQKPSKSLTYEFWVGTNVNTLAYSYFSELIPVGNKIQIIDWQMEFVSSGLNFPPETFQFVPPQGARAVPLPK